MSISELAVRVVPGQSPRWKQTHGRASDGKRNLTSNIAWANKTPETDEVAGRSKPRLIVCWNDAAPNYITSTAFTLRFTCWRCGALNWD
jgi:hypothetical protein